MATEYSLLIDGRFVQHGAPLAVYNKYSGDVIATVATARAEEVEQALAAAERARPLLAAMPAHQRSALLGAVAQALHAQQEAFAQLIAAEAGKALKYARAEVERAISTFTFAAEEAKRIHGETVPLDAVPSGEGYFGFWHRKPVGVVACISPFNFPLNLVAHKVAPALAAGNPIVLKPASSTPLTAVKLCEVLHAAGFPAGTVNLLVGSGATVGEALVTDPRVAHVTFTGSADVGRRITHIAGIKKVTLELGNTSPVVICADADLDHAVQRCAFGAYYNSGQICISVQRIYTDPAIHDAFTAKFVAASEALRVGDPLDPDTDVGPMIDRQEVTRITQWVQEAQAQGAQVLSGGTADGCVYPPTVLTEVSADMQVVAHEAFAPVASVIRSDDFPSALAHADATNYGLQASVFTRDIDRILQAIQRLDFGGVIINDAPAFRTDHMPYGGTRQSGIGREGVRFAIEDMTTIQMVAIRIGQRTS